MRSLAKPRVAVPPDAALPRIGRLLDAGAMAPVLQRSLGRGATFEAVRARYLRYKPGTNLVVHYEAVVDGCRHDAVVRIAAGDDLARRVRKPRNVAMARAVDGRSPAANPLVYDAELDAMIQWLPLDLSLPALAEHPAKLYRRLRKNGVEVPGPAVEPRLVAYKPRRRAVLRIGGHVLKAYAREAEFRAAVAGLRSTSDAGVVPVAAFEAAFPDLRLTVQEALGGSAPVRAADVAAEAGALLRDLQQLPVGDPRPAPPASQLAAAAESAALVEAIAPGLRRRLEALVRRLEAAKPGAVPGAAVVAHGDFHAGQLLRRGGELAVIDFDRLCAAPPALDLATYAAHLVNGRDSDLAAARTVLEDAASGYGERPDGLDWYLATSILRRAPFPFRYLDEGWPDLVEGMVGAAEEVLDESRGSPGAKSSRRSNQARSRTPIVDSPGPTDDPKMPFLARALDPAEARRRLESRLPGLGGRVHLRAIRMVRHKPGRRCLIEYDVEVERPGAPAETTVLVGKARARGPDLPSYRLQKALWNAGFGHDSEDGVCVPEPVGLIPELHMWLQRKVPGTVATRLLPGPGGTALARRIAEAAHKLHRAGIPPLRRPHTMADELRILHERLPLVARAAPRWAKRLQRILDACDRLGGTVPEPEPRGIHRDFYQDQVLVDGPRLYLLDLDLCCEGDPGLDIGNFVGHLTEQSLRATGTPDALAEQEEALEERFVELSGEATRAAVRAYATLTLARHVHLSTLFPERRPFTESLLELCEERLGTPC